MVATVEKFAQADDAPDVDDLPQKSFKSKNFLDNLIKVNLLPIRVIF